MAVRPATPGDVPAIAQVHVASWQATYRGLLPAAYIEARTVEVRERQWTAQLAAPDPLIVVAVDQRDDVVGFASGGPEREGDEQYRGELYALYLLPAVQRRGVGRDLVAAVAVGLVARDLPDMLAWVLRDNPACGFYAALGGTVVRARPVEMGGAQIAEVAYGWPDLKSIIGGLEQGERA